MSWTHHTERSAIKSSFIVSEGMMGQVTPRKKKHENNEIAARPVVHSHEHFTEHEGHEFHLESTGTTVEVCTFFVVFPLFGEA